MIRAELIIEGAAEVVTCAPRATPGQPAGAHPAGDAGRPLLLPQAETGVIPGGAVACAGGRIVFVGSAGACQREVVLDAGGTRIDARGGVVMPGFVDPHTHLPFGGWRAAELEKRIAGATYLEIAAAGGGILSTVRATRALGEGRLADLVRERLDEMLAAGTTTVEAKSGYGLSADSELTILRALAQAADHPVEVVPTLLGAHVVPPEFRDGGRKEWVRILVEELIPKVAAARLARYCDVYVDEGAYTVDEARAILEAAAANGLGTRVHAEQLTRTGAAWLAASMGAASVDHLERLEPVDIEALAATWRRVAPAASARSPDRPRAPPAAATPRHFPEPGREAVPRGRAARSRSCCRARPTSCARRRCRPPGRSSRRACRSRSRPTSTPARPPVSPCPRS